MNKRMHDPEIRRERNMMIEALSRKEIGIEEFIEYATKQSQFNALKRIPIYKVLATQPGWTTASAFKALADNGVTPDMSVSKVASLNHSKLILVSLFDAHPPIVHTIRRQVEAYPWRGSILEFFKKLPRHEVPVSFANMCREMVYNYDNDVNKELKGVPPLEWLGSQTVSEKDEDEQPQNNTPIETTRNTNSNNDSEQYCEEPEAEEVENEEDYDALLSFLDEDDDDDTEFSDLLFDD